MRAYQKPQITKVALRPQEQVLVGCKVTSHGSGPTKRCTVDSNRIVKCKTTTGS